MWVIFIYRATFILILMYKKQLYEFDTTDGRQILTVSILYLPVRSI